MPLLDPMCGAGTFLSEAAEITLGRAAGRSRALRLREARALQRGDVQRMLANAKKSERPVDAVTHLRLGPLRAIPRHAVLNLREAGLEDAVKLKQVNLSSSPRRSPRA